MGGSKGHPSRATSGQSLTRSSYTYHSAHRLIRRTVYMRRVKENVPRPACTESRIPTVEGKTRWTRMIGTDKPAPPPRPPPCRTWHPVSKCCTQDWEMRVNRTWSRPPSEKGRTYLQVSFTRRKRARGLYVVRQEAAHGGSLGERPLLQVERGLAAPESTVTPQV